MRAEHQGFGTWYLYGAQPATGLFTENESNVEHLWGSPNAGPYVKDAFHRRIVEGDTAAVNPTQCGTKFAAWSHWEIAPGRHVQVDLVLSRAPLEHPFGRTERTLSARQSEATVFYDDLLPEASSADHLILRQALAGMIWGKQFYQYDVDRWLIGDRVAPPQGRRQGRNCHWRHLKAHDVISMPDAWEYPWFAAWDLAFHCFKQFLAIAAAIAGSEESGTPALWDEEAGFFKDLLVCPDGTTQRIEVYSWVGIIPLFATEVVDRRLLDRAPRFVSLMKAHKGGRFLGSTVCACPDWENDQGEHLLALVDPTMLPLVLERLLDEDQFLSPHGVRSVSRVHAGETDLGNLPGIGRALMDYVPGEAESPMLGGNSNWRGPVWMPTNYALIQALEKYHRFLGPKYRVQVPCLGGEARHLGDIANLIAERLVNLYRRDQHEAVPALSQDAPFHKDPLWKDLYFFYEYFHGETGQGLGAAHQTGWTGLLANLVMRRYQKDITPWSGLDAGTQAARIEEIA